MRVRVRVKIFGKVQNVFFEHNMKIIAQRLNISGWVRLLPDGCLEAVFQGDQEAVQKMLKWCQVGPENARVTHLQVVWETPKPEGSYEFKILR